MSTRNNTSVACKPEECCGNCNTCTVSVCPYDSPPLTVAEYNLARELDEQITKDREQKPIDMTRYLRNRPDKEAYERERDRELDRARYWRNPEKHREKALQQYYNNRDEKLAKAKQRYIDNREELATKSRQRYHSNKEQISETRRIRRQAMKEMWKNMMRQTFTMNDKTTKELYVVKQKSINFPTTGIGYQISQVVDLTSAPTSVTKNGVTLPFKYLYEEIDLETDEVTYAHFISLNTVQKNHKWFLVEE